MQVLSRCKVYMWCVPWQVSTGGISRMFFFFAGKWRPTKMVDFSWITEQKEKAPGINQSEIWYLDRQSAVQRPSKSITNATQSLQLYHLHYAYCYPRASSRTETETMIMGVSNYHLCHYSNNDLVVFKQTFRGLEIIKLPNSEIRVCVVCVFE